MRQAVIYARVSSNRQHEEGFSIPAQLELLRAYAARQDFHVLEEFTDIESAKDTGRKCFRQMLELLKRSPHVVILVEKTDRLYRNLAEYVELEEARIEIHFVKEATIIKSESRSSDILAQDIKVMLARHYVRNLGEEVRKGQTKKAETGTFPSVAPIGYLNIGRKVVVDPERRDAIRNCFLLRAQGRTLTEVTKCAYQAGLRSRRGNRVHKSRIEKLLKQEFYYGVFRWNGTLYEGDHEPIVSKEEWDQAQPVTPRRQVKHDHPFRGLLRCALCGHSVTCERQKNFRYWHCARWKDGRCSWPWLRMRDLLSLLLGVVERVEFDDVMAREVRKAMLEIQGVKREELERDRQRAVRRKQEAERRLEQAYEDLLAERISSSFYDRQREKWESEREAALQEEVRLKSANDNFLEAGERVVELCNGLSDKWLTKEPAEQEQLLRVLCSNLVTDGLTITATYRKPFDALAEMTTVGSWLDGEDSNLQPAD